MPEVNGCRKDVMPNFHPSYMAGPGIDPEMLGFAVQRSREPAGLVVFVIRLYMLNLCTFLFFRLRYRFEVDIEF